MTPVRLPAYSQFVKSASALQDFDGRSSMATTRYYVDRIEGRIAVLTGRERDDGTIRVPVEQLPQGTGEGDWLSVQDDATGSETASSDSQGDPTSKPLLRFVRDDAVTK